MTTLFKLLSLFPLWLLHGLGWLMGWLVFALSGLYRRRLLEQARLAGYGWRQWTAAVGESGKMVAELPRLWLGRPVSVQWQGTDHLEVALTVGRGVVLLTPHLGCFEITAQAYAQRYGQQKAITVLFRPSRQPWLGEVMQQARNRPGLQTAPATLAGVKQMLKALRQGQTLGLLPDQVPPLGLGVWAQFWGREAYTMTLAARLAQQSGAKLVLTWGERLPWGRGYVVHYQALPGVLPQEVHAAAAQINQSMESLIRQCPQQYLWSYDRFKQPREEV